MAIRRQHGKVATVAKLAQLAGKSMAARRDYERKETMLQQAKEMQRREALAKYEEQNRMKRDMMAMDWENQKLAMRSQHEFAMEEMKQEAYMQRELAKEIKKLNEYDLAKDKLREALADRNITEEQYKAAMTNVDMKILGYPGVVPRPQAIDPIQELIKQYSGMSASPTGATPTATPTTTQPVYAINPKTKERLVSTDGGDTWTPVAKTAKKKSFVSPKYGAWYPTFGSK